MDNTPRVRAQKVLFAEEKALKNLRKSLDKNFDEAIKILYKRTGNIITTGIGKSSYVAMKIAATLTSLGQKAMFLHPTEAIHGDSGMVSDGDIILALSFSGETQEVLRLIKHLKKEFDIQVVALTRSKNSSLGKLSDHCIEITVSEEGSSITLAPMASTTATLVMGDMIASALTSSKKFELKHFARLHPGGGLALSFKTVEESMKTKDKIPLVKDSEYFTKVLVEISHKGLGVAGVVNNSGKLVGVVSDGDIRRFLASKNFAMNAQVKIFMTKKPKTIRKVATLREVLSVMEDHKITSLFAVDKNTSPIGIIHIHDIITA
jgi:arabinose-5-phosphate isomerase